MWGQIGDKEAGGPFTVTWHGKAKPSPRCSMSDLPQHMIYSVDSHTIALNNVMMTDASGQR